MSASDFFASAVTVLGRNRTSHDPLYNAAEAPHASFFSLASLVYALLTRLFPIPDGPNRQLFLPVSLLRTGYLEQAHECRVPGPLLPPLLEPLFIVLASLSCQIA